jgi:Na+-translocating ferredoxin:NAD+ oxidoreductase RNF subunit RnfB
MSANITCHCGVCGFEINDGKPCLSLLCGCTDCRHALEWCSHQGGAKPSSLPELIYVKSDILSVKGKEFMHAFKLRSTGRSTRIYCEKCFSIIGVDHKSYRDNVFMFFKYHCSTSCDLSIEPSAAIYLDDLQDASQISKLENIPLIFSFSEIETREFREIKRVSNSFNEINRPRYGQTLKSVIHSMSKIEILN